MLRRGRPPDQQPDEEPDRRRVHDLRGVPDAVGHQLALRFGRADGPGDRVVPVDHGSLRRLHQGHHRHQAPRVLPELHHVRPLPDGEVGRLRAVARLDVC